MGWQHQRIDAENVTTGLICAERGYPPPLLNVAERRAVAIELTRRGWSMQRIGDALGVHPRTAGRYRRG